MTTRRQLLCAAAGALALPSHAALTNVAPDFALRALSGPNMRLAEQRGRVVMLNFWATWCGPCRVELPLLSKLYDKYRASGFVLMGINVDDDARKAAEVNERLALSFPVLHDAEKSVSKAYDLATMPTTVLVDRDGRVRHVHQGYRDGYELTYDKQVRELLK